jgi:hypothetical protein
MWLTFLSRQIVANPPAWKNRFHAVNRKRFATSASV